MISYPAFKDFIFDRIKRDIADDNGLQPFVWMFSNTENNVVAMPITDPMDTQSDQQKLRMMMKIAAEKYKAEMFAFASEAWQSVQAIDEPRKFRRAGEDPNRREIILINFECKNIIYIQQTYIIPLDNTDPKKKKLIDPNNPIVLSGGRGWQSGLLKDKHEYSITGY